MYGAQVVRIVLEYQVPGTYLVKMRTASLQVQNCLDKVK